MNASWTFPTTGPYRVQGRGLAEDNFAQEEKSGLEILIREAFQNPLDARAKGNSGSVQVRLSVLKSGQFDANYLASLITEEYMQRLIASGGEPLPDIANSSVLVLEDFGTTGLEGNFLNPDIDGNQENNQENWNAFWFREGEGAKSAVGSNGRAGQGKVTYYRVGAARSVFGLTVRQSDGKQLLMGRSSFRRVYPFANSKYERDAFWCVPTDFAQPVDDTDALDRFRTAFQLSRKKDEPGLSLVIPFSSEIDNTEAMRAIVAEFYVPIARGRLEIIVGDWVIGQANLENIADHVFPDEVAHKYKSSFTKGFRMLVQSVIEAEKLGFKPIELKSGWAKATALSEDYFPEGTLESLRASLAKGERISIRCPVTVKPKKNVATQTWFDVHLQLPEELERVEEAYIRRDLLIGSEKHLAVSSYLQKARGLTLIEDETLSAFMADAEEPTHLKWNASRPRLAEDYLNPKDTVKAVRQALPRLLTLLSNGSVKQDVKALAKYFTKPAVQGSKHSTGGQKAGNKDTNNMTEPPEPKRKPFRIDTSENHVRVLPNGLKAPNKDELPIHCELELAYEGLDQDPFKEYDTFDFDLSDSTTHEVQSIGIQNVSKSENKVEFDVIDPAFELQINGFDPNIRMRARLNFEGVANGATVSTE
jgi:hypothetical protein